MVWVLRDAYEFVPDTNFVTVTERSWGQIFRLGGTARIKRIAWYRGQVSTPAPATVSVWDGVSGARLYKNSDPPDDGTVGWQEIDLGDHPLDFVVLNSQPMVAAYGGTGTLQSYGAEGSELKGEYPANVNLNTARSNNSIGDQMPTSPFVGQRMGLDIDAEVIPLTGGSVDAEITEAELARWLREDGDHYDESAIKSILGQAAGANETVQSEEFGNAVIHQDTQDLLSRWSAALATKLNTAADQIAQVATDFTTALATSLTAGMARLDELWNDILACFGGTPGALLCIVQSYLKFLRGEQPLDPETWELVDETDFTDNLEWPVEADLYRVNFTAFDPAGTTEAFGTQTRYGYLAKWSPLFVTFAKEWHYVNTPDADLEDGGRRMPGLGLIMYRPGAGHVQAWRKPEGA